MGNRMGRQATARPLVVLLAYAILVQMLAPALAAPVAPGGFGLVVCSMGGPAEPGDGPRHDAACAVACAIACADLPPVPLLTGPGWLSDRTTRPAVATRAALVAPVRAPGLPRAPPLGA